MISSYPSQLPKIQHVSGFFVFQLKVNKNHIFIVFLIRLADFFIWVLLI
jgi:hypothetical protein